MSAALRTEQLATASRPLSGNVWACPACGQEMESPDENLPLHMAQGKLCIGSETMGASPKFGEQIREPLIIPDVSKLGVSEILAADTCMACGGPKTPGQTVCKTCHGMLPFLNQKCLPDFVHGYLFVEEQRKVSGIKKSLFMEVFQEALTVLAAMRGGAPLEVISE